MLWSIKSWMISRRESNRETFVKASVHTPHYLLDMQIFAGFLLKTWNVFCTGNFVVLVLSADRLTFAVLETRMRHQTDCMITWLGDLISLVVNIELRKNRTEQHWFRFSSVQWITSLEFNVMHTLLDRQLVESCAKVQQLLWLWPAAVRLGGCIQFCGWSMRCHWEVHSSQACLEAIFGRSISACRPIRGREFKGTSPSGCSERQLASAVLATSCHELSVTTERGRSSSPICRGRLSPKLTS